MAVTEFHFKVTLGSVGEISFSEVSGLETEFEEITYRAGDSNDFTKLKMPGLKKVSDITLKKVYSFLIPNYGNGLVM